MMIINKEKRDFTSEIDITYLRRRGWLSILPIGLFPYFVEHLDEFVVDHERDGNVQTHSTQSRDSSFVESFKNKK